MHDRDIYNQETVEVERVRSGIPRPVEIVVVVFFIVVSLPILFVLWIILALTSRAPVIFRQARVGRGGKEFTLFKMRTMVFEPDGLQVTAADDKRVTRIGRVLRRTKLDELPELWNILKGDMSLVGPRPEVPRYVNLENENWLKVLEVRPGLTDPVTICMKNEDTLLATVKGDRERFYVEQLQPFKIAGYLEYQQRRTWLSDVKVLFDTSLTFIDRRGVQFPSSANTQERYRVPTLPDEVS